MSCKSWKSSLPFAVTFLVGILAVNVLGQELSSDKKQETLKPDSSLFNDLKDARGFRDSGARTLGENGAQVRVSMFIDEKELQIREQKLENFSIVMSRLIA